MSKMLAVARPSCSAHIIVMGNINDANIINMMQNINDANTINIIQNFNDANTLNMMQNINDVHTINIIQNFNNGNINMMQNTSSVMQDRDTQHQACAPDSRVCGTGTTAAAPP
jgi:hypothetical protein